MRRKRRLGDACAWLGRGCSLAIEPTRRACKRLAAVGLMQVDYQDHPGYLRPRDRLWLDVIAERGYEPDVRPAASCWALVVRRTPARR